MEDIGLPECSSKYKGAFLLSTLCKCLLAVVLEEGLQGLLCKDEGTAHIPDVRTLSVNAHECHCTTFATHVSNGSMNASKFSDMKGFLALFLIEKMDNFNFRSLKDW